MMTVYHAAGRVARTAATAQLYPRASQLIGAEITFVAAAVRQQTSVSVRKCLNCEAATID